MRPRAIRKRAAVFDAPMFVFHLRYLDELASRGEGDRIRAAEARGAEYGAGEAAQYALAGVAVPGCRAGPTGEDMSEDMSEAHRPAIRTPDQRIRVFVSSTLRELAPERRAVRAAIEELRLAPVMFELGARPHPPRELYRAYLQQSDVFVGIYGDSYGWTAPGEDVSGLEDEYNLAPARMPKLVYLKESDAREEPA